MSIESKRGLFHGGCCECKQAKQGGTAVCVGCMYFERNWNLPNRNDVAIQEEKVLHTLRRRVRKLSKKE